MKTILNRAIFPQAFFPQAYFFRAAFFLALSCFALAAALAEEPAEGALFRQNFDACETGELPEGLMALDGEFSVESIEGAKALRLPGEPLSDYGMMFGPSEQENISITAVIRGERKKRQFPRFGVGLNGMNGFKLFVNPAKRVLELRKRNDVAAEKPFQWISGAWISLRLDIQKENDAWIIRGKAWSKGEKEPESWQVEFKDEQSPMKGKASIWGTPYSGHDIWFDDIVFQKTAE